MAHRLGDGTHIDDLELAQQLWRAADRGPATFCNRSEWDAWQDDIGELVLTIDGTEIRKHATLKANTRGGNPKIVHNRVIVGNPAKYAAWKAEDTRKRAEGVPANKLGWMGEWTYYPPRDLQRLIDRYADSTEPTPAELTEQA